MSEMPDLTPEALMAEARWLRALARRLVGDPAAADDLVQETWLTALGRGRMDQGPPRAWLAAVLRRLSHTRRRSEARRAQREESPREVPEPPDPADLAQRAEGQRLLAEAVLRLPEAYRSVVVLRYTEDLEPAEIAARLNLPPGTVRSRLKRAVDRLREDLDARWGGREAWVTALLPFSGLRSGLTASSTTAAAGAAGAMWMSKKVLGGVAVVLLGFLGWWGWQGAAARPDAGRGAVEPPADRLTRAANPGNVLPELETPSSGRLPEPGPEPEVAPQPETAPRTGWWLVGSLVGPAPGTADVEVELRTGYRQEQPSLRWKLEPGAPVELELTELFEHRTPRPETLLVAADHPDFLPAEVHLNVERDALRRGLLDGEGVEFPLALELRPARAHVHGRVTWPSGDPVLGARAALVPFDGDDPAGPPTEVVDCDDLTGAYSLRTDRVGAHRVVAYRLPNSTWGDWPTRPEDLALDLQADDRIELPDLVLRTGEVIDGRVELAGGREADTGSIRAVLRGAPEGMHPDGWGWRNGRFVHRTIQASLGEGGRFFCGGLEPADYDVSYHAGTTFYLSSDLRPRPRTVAAPARDLVLAYGFHMARIRVLSGGEPLLGSTAAFRSPGGGGWSRKALGSAEHRFAVGPGETYAVTVSHPDYGEQRVEVVGDQIALENRIDVDLGLVPQHATLALTLAGDPLRQMEYGNLVLRRVDGGPGDALFQRRVAREEDVLRFDELDPGRYEGYLAPSGRTGESTHGTYFLSEPVSVELVAGFETQHTVRLREGGRLALSRELFTEEDTHRYRVLGPGGEAVWITMYSELTLDGSVYPLRSDTLDPEFDWETDGALAPGAYTIEIVAPSGSTQRHAFELRAGQTTHLPAR